MARAMMNRTGVALRMPDLNAFVEADDDGTLRFEHGGISDFATLLGEIEIAEVTAAAS